MALDFRRLELNGGQVVAGANWYLHLPAVATGYADAQIDDYGGRKRRDYLWKPGTKLQLRARYSHSAANLVGTGGFGFWNAPFGDPTVPFPALPKAAWFFFASKPSNLPLALSGPSRHWFAATVDAATPKAMLLAPLAPAVLALNHFRRVRQLLWPRVRQRLGISYVQLGLDLSLWHKYAIEWEELGCTFRVNDIPVLETSHSPSGRLGFVCWLDNQYLVATPTGRLRWGTLPVPRAQWLEIEGLEITN